MADTRSTTSALRAWGPPPLPSVSPHCLLGAPRPLPPRRRHSRPGHSGKHSVVWSRLSGSSAPQMWAEWAVAGRAQAGGTGHPRPPTAARVLGEGGGRRHSRRQMLHALPCLKPSQGSRCPLNKAQALPEPHKACATYGDPSLPLPLHSGPAPRPRCSRQQARPGCAPGPLHVLVH